MKNYFNYVAVTLHSGKVKLTKDQAKVRLHCLGKPSKGVYQIEKPITFKAGEEFGYDGEIPKTMVNDLEEVEKAAAEKSS